MKDSSCSSSLSAAGLVDTSPTVFTMLDHPADLARASATIFTMLDDPADIAHASAVSHSWRQFVIANQFSKLQCLRACPEVSTFMHVDVTTSGSSSTTTTRQDQPYRDRRVYTHLAHSLLSEYMPRDCIIHCIGASSTDEFPMETIENTLHRLDQLNFRPCYWSSRGNRDPAAPECLIYRLQADLCLVDEIKMKPFKALFQIGDPIYSAKSIRFQMGYPRSPLRPEALVCDENEGQLIDDRNYVWTYTSPEFPVLQEDVLQSFKLPRQVLCIGGVVKVELLGRAQKQAIDGLYYVCVSHVQILGKPLSRELGVVPRGNGLVLNYYLDPRTCGIPASESSGDDAAAGGIAWRRGSGILELREGLEG